MKRLRILTFLVCLIPFVLLLLKVLQNDLGPDPAKELALETGEWSIRFLLLALAMTPLRHLSGRMEFAQRRRMVGLFALFYASVHFLVWVIFLLGLRWGAILEEVVERPLVIRPPDHPPRRAQAHPKRRAPVPAFDARK